MKKNIVIILLVLLVSSIGVTAYIFASGNYQVSADDDIIGGIGYTDPNTNSSGSIPLPTKPDNLPDVQVESVINTAIKGIFAVGEIAFIIVLLIGGVMYITSAGNEESAGKARKLMLNAIIGIVILFSAYGIAQYIISILK